VREIAQRAEGVGFDSLWVSDGHTGRAGAEAESFGLWEPWSLLAALAAATDRAAIGTLALSVPKCTPVLPARMAVTVDEISGSRLVVGLGADWPAPKGDTADSPFDRLVGRFEDAIQAIAGLLCGQEVPVADADRRVTVHRLCQLGPTLGGPPLMITGSDPRIAELAARYADVWDCGYINDPMSIVNARARMDIIDAACDTVGRDPGTLQRYASIMVEAPGAARPAGHRTARSYASGCPASGTPEELADLLLAYADEGFSGVQALLDPSSVDMVEAFAPVLEALDNA
jgi:alkanesulfonate monooxygenase SsuD/methylene tetrahydromethanopterin reductase-like flavin-dependent oxidoreductase (luciferase family)